MGIYRWFRRRRRRAASSSVLRENARLRLLIRDLEWQLKGTQEELAVGKRELLLTYDVIERDRLRVAAESKIQATLIAGTGAAGTGRHGQ